MARYTVKTLSNHVDKINGWLKDSGYTGRLEVGGRNNYQAVDEYSVDADGNRIGSGVNRNVCCGTSRECGDAADFYYGGCVRAREFAELEAFREAAKKQEKIT